jgi:HEPN domain-containing protein
MEWYDFAEQNLETALLLHRENHYTDVIAIDIQQAVDFYKKIWV